MSNSYDQQQNPAKWVLIGVASLIVFVVFLFANPFAWNDGGERTVVQQTGGKQFVQFDPGMYYAGLFAKKTSWPNQISVAYQDSVPNLEVEDNSIEIGKIQIRFGGDASTADVKGITQYILPADEKDMILIHNTHRTPISLVTKRLAPYTKECLQSSAQVMSSEMHYSGGRTQMVNDFRDQLQNGTFLLYTKEATVYDSLEKENKRVYQTANQKNADGTFKRKTSSIKEYGITVADAAVTDVDYESRIDNMLAKKIDATTKASVSKQELMTAQQQALTAKAKGEQALVEIEYQQKQEQTKQVVVAETQVKVAELENRAMQLTAQKIRTEADAQSYANSRLVSAGLTPQERAEYNMKTQIGVAAEVAKISLPTTYIGGGTGSSNGVSMLESILGVKLLNKE